MFEIPLSRSMHVASRCAIKCCHCMYSSSLLIPRTTSCMASTSWCLPSDLPPSYTLDFMQLHRKKFNGFKSGDRVGYPTSPFLLIHLPSYSFKIPLPLCRNVEVLRHIVTFILVLEEAHPLNTEVIHFPENFCKIELWTIPGKRAVQRGYCLILYTTHELKIAVESDTVTWCEFSCAQECEFLVF